MTPMPRASTAKTDASVRSWDSGMANPSLVSSVFFRIRCARASSK
jgi:hypothetical protein